MDAKNTKPRKKPVKKPVKKKSVKPRKKQVKKPFVKKSITQKQQVKQNVKVIVGDIRKRRRARRSLFNKPPSQQRQQQQQPMVITIAPTFTQPQQRQIQPIDVPQSLVPIRQPTEVAVPPVLVPAVNPVVNPVPVTQPEVNPVNDPPRIRPTSAPPLIQQIQSPELLITPIQSAPAPHLTPMPAPAPAPAAEEIQSYDSPRRRFTQAIRSKLTRSSPVAPASSNPTLDSMTSSSSPVELPTLDDLNPPSRRGTGTKERGIPAKAETAFKEYLKNFVKPNPNKPGTFMVSITRNKKNLPQFDDLMRITKQDENKLKGKLKRAIDVKTGKITNLPIFTKDKTFDDDEVEMTMKKGGTGRSKLGKPRRVPSRGTDDGRGGGTSTPTPSLFV